MAGILQAAIALALAGGLAGCGGFFSMPDRVAETQAQVTEVQRRQEALAKEMADLRQMIEQQETLLREMRADQQAAIGEVRNTIDVLRNQLDQANRQTKARPRPPAPTPGDTTAATNGPPAGSAPALEEEGLYQVALQNLQQGKYPLAVTGFREYMSKFPEGNYVDDAQYGIAESYYAQSDFPTAAIEFRGLVDRYPTSERVPAALYKAGLSYFESGREDLGRAYLERVANEYPYSDEGLKAKSRLENLH
ncbi:MAG TPA: tol-pal system protein YbgF [Candidatus Udaeobacter sp.]|nr:tol-pal system protein YbgF [Candidatus Udaeobacter sp.]